MTQPTISDKRRHIYFYTLLVLVTVSMAGFKSVFSHKSDATAKTRAAEVNKLANTLFQ